MLSAWGMRKPKSDEAARAAGYVFLLSTVGLAAVFYFAYASFFVLRQACPLCLTMYVSVIGIFLLSSAAAGPLRALQSGVTKDLGGLKGSPTAALLAVMWLVASAGLVLAFPREQAASAQSASAPAAVPAVPVETLSPEQLTEVQAWLDRQPTVPEVMPTGQRQGSADQVQRLSVPVVSSGLHPLQGHHREVRGGLSWCLQVREPGLPARDRVRSRWRSWSGMRSGRRRATGQGKEPR